MENHNDDNNKTNEPTVGNPSGGIFGGCAIQILGAILFLAIMGSSPGGAIFCGFAGVIAGGLIIMSAQNRHARETRQVEMAQQERKSKNIEIVKSRVRPKYNEMCDKYKRVLKYVTVSSLGFPELSSWINNDTLYFLSTWERVEWMIEHNTSENLGSTDNFEYLVHFDSIPLENIHSFQKEGEIYMETKISGGGGGGSSVKGAIVGGLIAGDAGAIIGSRKEITSISSETIKHDDRQTILYYHDADSKNLKQHCFTPESYIGFMSLIPDKELQIVTAKESVKNTTLSISDQIKELSKLKDEGILTEEEFTAKKKELLERI